MEWPGGGDAGWRDQSRGEARVVESAGQRQQRWGGVEEAGVTLGVWDREIGSGMACEMEAGGGATGEALGAWLVGGPLVLVCEVGTEQGGGVDGGECEAEPGAGCHG